MTVLRNVLGLVFTDSMSGWRRDFRTFFPALAAMALLLTFSGIVCLLAYAGAGLVQAQTTDAAVLHAYLASTDEGSVISLESKLRADPRVSRVTYVSKEEALKRAQSQPGLSDLAGATAANPFPASLEIHVRRIQDLGPIDALVKREADLDPQLQTSYDPGAYSRLGQLILVLTVAGVALLGLLAAVAVGITGASVRGVVVARREELRALDLLGAPGWVLRAPFVTQGALTGVLAGLVAAICVLGLYAAEAQATKVNVVQWLPTVAAETALVAAGLLAISGMCLGALTSLTEIRHL